MMVPARPLDGHRPTAADIASAHASFLPSSSLVTVPIYQVVGFTYVFTSFNGESCLYCMTASSPTWRPVTPS